MSGFFAARNNASDPWFRVGRLEVGTVMLVVAAVVFSWLAYALCPAFSDLLAYYPQQVVEGQVWRLVTWPLSNAPGLWGVLSLFFFWYFGTDLEQAVGRKSDGLAAARHVGQPDGGRLAGEPAAG
ncbi:MAG: hypothetical protein QM804_17925 [Propionicimonas sp.]